MPMAERTATTGWDGDLAHGNGVVNGASGALNELQSRGHRAPSAPTGRRAQRS